MTATPREIALHHIARAADPNLLTADGAQAEAKLALAAAALDLADALRTSAKTGGAR